ncbi:hypothetical protein [Microbacterium sp. NPDC076911]|uniref:hypothetical protein n=1 Tax=Microbacterium sp. NPDC076911 TaxID=3154958 RepID=UPI003447402F
MVSKADQAHPSTLARVGLELSLKPFRGWSQDALDNVAHTVFEQWANLISAADSTAILLWIADGSEILEWRDELSDEVTWASSVGFSNTEVDPYGVNVTPEMIAEPYSDHIPVLTYADIQRIIVTLKRVGEAATGKPVSVGATFDAGPEFAKSAFKYVRHPELVARGEDRGLGKLIQMVRANSRLNEDAQPYAAFPEGIAQDTSFGEFLGKQSQSYLSALGFDYLWLSNGFGFSAYSWTPLGETFDGATFAPERAEAASESMLQFWRDFGQACTFPVEVRGTNFTTGIDIGGDATPAREIYASGQFRNPPPNSPWGPLNEDFGIEMSGYLSRISVLPADGFLFRFYANDPWFWQNPWWDFYNREPFDIFLPLSVARIDNDGCAQTAQDIQILAIDTQAGQLDGRVGQEVGSRILQALEATPDEAGPLVWLYPFDEYHDDLAGDPDSIRHPYFEDWYLTAALNAGLPLNTVVSTSALETAAKSGALRDRTIVAPTRTLTESSVNALRKLVVAGARVLAYGPIDRASASGKVLLGLAESPTGIEGDLQFVGDIVEDCVQSGMQSTVLRHIAALSGGPVSEVLRDDSTDVVAHAHVSDGQSRRVYATSHALGEGTVAWVRGSSTFEKSPVDNHGLRNPKHLDPALFRDAGSILTGLLEHLGTHVSSRRQTLHASRPVQALHRHDNAYWISGYLADLTTQPRLRLPHGVPVFTHTECWIEDGVGTYPFGKSYHHEGRVFVDQKTAGTLSCREIAHFPYGTSRSLNVRGLVEANVTVMVSKGYASTARVLLDGQPIEPTRNSDSDVLEIAGVTGALTISW